jgi:polysaccharide pyruvyl transferase WcaK-like protein
VPVKFRILLLTNRDSDNVGDQIIEATAVSILRGVLKNLGMAPRECEISSRAAGIIAKKYLSTGDPKLLKDAREEIAAADVVVFGGAPIFNYSYQAFYRRTIETLELADEYGVPVLFSSIGVEPFDPTNPKSVALKEALGLPVVRQITTRDDFESLQRYVEGTDISVALVSDPAVLADVVFRHEEGLKHSISRAARRVLRIPAPVQRVRLARSVVPDRRKRIGLVVTRPGIFKDNGITFSGADQRRLWLDVRDLLTERGYDHRFFTTGHFPDEVFLDTLVRNGDVLASKATVTVNSPEELINELRGCDGVIAYRLHASIMSFAYGIPSVGLSWNFKVPSFYESIGHGERALGPDRWNAEEVVTTLEQAIAEGVTKDEAYLMSAYETLFAGLKNIIAPNDDQAPFTYAQVREELPQYGGTTLRQYRAKMGRKLRRTYESYESLRVALEAAASQRTD